MMSVGEVLLGYKNGVGAAAFVVTSVRWDGEHFQSALLGVGGTFIAKARSAFQAEVIALDNAVDFILQKS